MNFGKIQKVAGGFLGGAGKIDGILKAAQGLLCLPSLLSQFKTTDIKNLLKGLAGFAANLAASIASSIVSAVAEQINSMVNAAVNAILGPLRLLQSYANALVSIIDRTGKIISRIGDMVMGIRDKLKNLKVKAPDLRAFLMNQQNCNVKAADFMNCLLKGIANKLTKKVVSKLQNPLKKLDAQLTKLHKEIAAETFKVGGMMEQYVGRHIRAADKLTRQLDIMLK